MTWILLRIHVNFYILLCQQTIKMIFESHVYQGQPYNIIRAVDEVVSAKTNNQ